MFNKRDLNILKKEKYFHKYLLFSDNKLFEREHLKTNITTGRGVPIV